MELDSGLSTIKLAPILLAELEPYVCAGLGVLNIVVNVVADVGGSDPSARGHSNFQVQRAH
jgi:hypothetical protein